MIDFFAIHTWLFIILIGLLGVAIGSFLNVVIHRLPIMIEREWRKECLESISHDAEMNIEFNRYSLVFPPSHCPLCNRRLKIWQNIPLISYIILGGKCASCKAPIPFRYFLVELLSCILAIVVAFSFGVSIELIAALLFTWILIAITFIDLEHQILPDGLTLGLLWLGLFFSCFNLFASPMDAILGAIIGYLFFWIIGKAFMLITKKDGLGQGDFKLLAAAGAWVGWEILPFIILSSAVLGLLIGGGFLLFKRKNRNTPIPFAPFIAIAAWISIMWGFDITQSYLHLFGIYWSNV